MSSIYVVYLTIYTGNKLPMFYIGSSTEKKIMEGYHGSVSSKQYKPIWKEELKNNPNLFKTKIITKHNTDKEAREKELYFQKHLRVVGSSFYINKSLAIPNGYFGMNVSGKNNPMYGKSRLMAEETKQKISDTKKGKLKSEATKQKMRKPKPKRFGLKLLGNQNAKGKKSWLGKKHTEETKQKLREKARIQWEKIKSGHNQEL
jgi:NUMOD3 motif